MTDAPYKFTLVRQISDRTLQMLIMNGKIIYLTEKYYLEVQAEFYGLSIITLNITSISSVTDTPPYRMH